MAGKRQSTDHKIGECPCGRAIKIGDRYSVSTERPTTIKRVCDGYQCGRVNEIELTVRTRIVPTNWEIHTCLCGSPVYTRSEYAGPYFEGYEGPHYPYSVPESAYKNRTVKMPCRGCSCKYVIQIRFTKKKEGGRERDTLAKVYRCPSCRREKERRENASAS